MKSKEKNLSETRNDAHAIFTHGLRAVDPESAIRRYCKIEDSRLVINNIIYDLSRYRNLYVIGAGKASASMAGVMEDMLGENIKAGIITVKYHHVKKLDTVKLVEAGHPVPDKNGEKGALAILDLVKDAEEDDLVLCLISGGGSALLPLPAKGITLEDKQVTINVLLACGATIHEINTIRKHISRVKGGRLAQAVYPATLVTLMLSDVVGDNKDVIASGPTVGDPSIFADCLQIIDKYKIAKKLPDNVVRHLRAGASGKAEETPKKDDPVFKDTQNLIIGSNIDALAAAEKKAKQLGYRTIILSSMIEGETTHAAEFHTAIAREILKSGYPASPPACILSGGETTVTITGKGKGGRNQEFVLAAAIGISNENNIVILSGGTDGTDGPTDAAGAVADSETLARAEALGLNPRHFLAHNDAYHFFQKLDDLLITGPTHTNVMDLRIMLIV